MTYRLDGIPSWLDTQVRALIEEYGGDGITIEEFINLLSELPLILDKPSVVEAAECREVENDDT